MTRDECINKAVDWAERAEAAMPDKGVQLGVAANVFAMPQAAAAIASAYATLALSADAG